MATSLKTSHYCEKCKKTMNADQFYRSLNLEKYPEDGVMNLCKKCLTMHIDNWKPETYLPILKEVDVPYIPDEWNKLLAKYGKDRSKVTGMTIFGRYLAKMRLNQYSEYRWKDTEFIQQLKDKETKEAMTRQGYDTQEIAQTLMEKQSLIPDVDSVVYDHQAMVKPEEEPNPFISAGESDYFDQQNDIATEELVAQLTDEDKIYLRLKWGKNYRPDEWVALENLYNEMTESYDIQTAGHFDTLKMVCKTSLKANQLLDIGDIDGAQKAVKMYEQLMKSGKFTAAQNKAENGEYVDCIGSLVALCEADGFIPRYYVDEPQDKVDRTLQDLQNYTKTLIMEETNLGTLIEKAVKDIQVQKEKEAEMDADAATDDEALEAELFDSDQNAYLKDEDFAELRRMEDEEAEIDDEQLLELVKDGVFD